MCVRLYTRLHSSFSSLCASFQFILFSFVVLDTRSWRVQQAEKRHRKCKCVCVSVYVVGEYCQLIHSSTRHPHTYLCVFFNRDVRAPAKALSGRAGRGNVWRLACVCFPLCLNTTVAHSIAIASDGVLCGVCVCVVVWWCGVTWCTPSR